MAIESGIGWTTFSVDDGTGDSSALQALVSNVLNVDWDISRETIDSTSMDLSSHKRLIGLGDFSINMTVAFDDAATFSFDVFKTVGTSDFARTIDTEISGQGLNNEVFLTSAALNRGADGSFQWSSTGVLEDGTDPTWS